jgi:tRNA dimethylallyltransferase
MVGEGLETEAHGLQAYRQLPVLQTVGYQEWWAYFAGRQTKARTIELIQRNSRRYAKRQNTWFRHYSFVTDAETLLANWKATRTVR